MTSSEKRMFLGLIFATLIICVYVKHATEVLRIQNHRFRFAGVVQQSIGDSEVSIPVYKEF